MIDLYTEFTNENYIKKCEKIFNDSVMFHCSDLSEALNKFTYEHVITDNDTLTDEIAFRISICLNELIDSNSLTDILSKKISNFIDSEFFGSRNRIPNISQFFNTKKLKKRESITSDDIKYLEQYSWASIDEESVWIMDVQMFNRLLKIFSYREGVIQKTKSGVTIFGIPVHLLNFPCSVIFCGSMKNLKIINFELQPFYEEVAELLPFLNLTVKFRCLYKAYHVNRYEMIRIW